MYRQLGIRAMADTVMSTSVASEFAVWLTPIHSDRRWLTKVIQDYATAYEFPVFEPHVTVYSGRALSTDNLRQIVKDAILAPQMITLQVLGLNYTESFFKTGFIDFEATERLTQMSQTIRERLTQPVDYVLDPHLSLIYKDIPIDQKRLAMLRFVLSVSKVTFDTVKVIIPGANGWGDITGWTEQFCYSLIR
jgi:hypothetical protein